LAATASESTIGSLIKGSLVLSAATAATQLYGITDQIFVGRISSDLLRIHFYVDYFILAFLLVSRSLGQTLLVTLPKARDEDERAAHFSSALSLALYLAVAVGLVSLALSYSGIGVFAAGYARQYLWLQIASALIIVLNGIQKFTLISRKMRSLLLVGELLGNLVNLALNAFSFYFFADDAWRFRGIAGATLFTQIVLFIFYFNYNRKVFRWAYFSPGAYWRRAKALISGESFNMALLTFFPLGIAVAMDTLGRTDLFLGYNLGLKWGSFLSMPLVALTMLGTIEFSSNVDSNRRLSSRLILSGSILVGIPVVIVSGLSSAIVTSLVNIHLEQSHVLFLWTILAILPGIVFMPLAARARSVERPYLIGGVELGIRYAFELPLFLLVLFLKMPVLILGAGFFVVELVKIGALKFFLNRSTRV
jgi:hypothetical protein